MPRHDFPAPFLTHPDIRKPASADEGLAIFILPSGVKIPRRDSKIFVVDAHLEVHVDGAGTGIGIVSEKSEPPFLSSTVPSDMMYAKSASQIRLRKSVSLETGTLAHWRERLAITLATRPASSACATGATRSGAKPAAEVNTKPIRTKSGLNRNCHFTRISWSWTTLRTIYDGTTGRARTRVGSGNADCLIFSAPQNCCLR